MKIAVIGSGISGLVSSYVLAKEHEVTVFEANDYVGGHTATVDVEVDNKRYAIDTGFIVFNDRTYPNFEKLLDELNIVGQNSEMSFSVNKKDIDFEYNGHTLTSMFAKNRHWLSPSFYGFVGEILRFNKLSKSHYDALNDNNEKSLGEFLTEHNFSDKFQDYYLLPMCAAIWSMSVEEVLDFPLGFFLKFFNHHGLLNVADRPQWKVIPGGSREYVRALLKKTKAQIRLSTPVEAIHRSESGVVVTTADGTHEFDQIVMACHSDQSLALLTDPTDTEKDVLGGIKYANNEVVLHTDTNILPKRERAWASWNYRIANTTGEKREPATVTYDMNILQGIESEHTFCVTLNDTKSIEPSKILRKFNYMHPVYNRSGFAARQRRSEICGTERTHFCGAYWYNGFHEDGVKSALDVCKRFGLSL